jgi:LuxR family maltose regulon positive regulatory protein
VSHAYAVAVPVAEVPAVPLLRTKVHGPVARALVARPELVDRLAHGPARRLTLIRGQAGWGKSSLLAAWSAADPRRFAWLALDQGDNDPVRFFLYAIEALRNLADGVGERSAPLLGTPGVDVAGQVLPVLINELDALPERGVFVLEDYHEIDNVAVHDAVSYLVDRAPQGLEIVLSTRVQPPLPVSRLRGRGQLLEIAASDLRFSIDDAQTLLVAHQGLVLDPPDIRRLVERTEGWPAGLYLAALSLRGRDDAHEFVDRFAGDDRDVADYLTTEVLAGHSVPTRAFMLSTSVLDRLCAPLCDAVIGGTGSAEMLQSIESSNSFLLALDNRREWYRYHRLFRDLLRNELLSADPAGAETANRRAATWLRHHGAQSEAIPHLVASGDVEEAGEVIASSWLPVATSGRHEEVGRWIARAARAPARGPFHDGFGSGAAAADCLRTVHSWLLGDLGACRAAGEAALRHTGEPSPWDGVTGTWLGAAQFWLGHPEEGLATMREALQRCQAASFHPPWIACLGMLGLMHHLQGDQEAAREFSEQALSLSDRLGLDEHSRITAAAHITRAGLLTRNGRAAQARTELERVVETAHRGSGPVEMAHARIALSIAARDSGDTDGARVFRQDAQATIRGCPDPGPVVTAWLRQALAGAAAPRHAASLPTPPAADFSDRETDVLRLMAGTLSQREIGGILFISFNTVKTHTKNIFRKLGVGTRAEAVARARELNLIR